MYPYQTTGLIKVNGIDGARAYQMMMPNSTVALFDANEDIFYIKSTDAGGFANIRSYKFTPCENQENPSLVTREEFEKLKEEIENAIKSVRSNATNKQPDYKSGQRNNEQHQ